MHLLAPLSFVIDLIFPTSCVGCGKLRTRLCANCLTKIPAAPPPQSDYITACFSYQDARMRTLIHKLKYEQARDVAALFGEPLHEMLLSILGDSLETQDQEMILVVPIPLHSKRQRERGYNQSELLARALITHDMSDTFSIETKILNRTRNTRPQARKEGRKERYKNLENAFVCTAPGKVRGKVVVLIDDVTTTGATFDAARQALRKAGARNVFALALTH